MSMNHRSPFYDRDCYVVGHVTFKREHHRFRKRQKASHGPHDVTDVNCWCGQHDISASGIGSCRGINL